MKGENAKADKYVEGLIGALKGRSDASRADILMEKVEYWYKAAMFWRDRFYEKKMVKLDETMSLPSVDMETPAGTLREKTGEKDE
jgi:hypothetical protein